jgi:hypothetical protein
MSGEYSRMRAAALFVKHCTSSPFFAIAGLIRSPFPGRDNQLE